MSTSDQRVSAEAWDSLLSDIKDLGPMPDESAVMTLLINKIWATEGITLDYDNRGEAGVSDE